MDVLTSRDGGIYCIEFNRAHKKNAITSAMYAELADALEEAAADPAVRVLLLSGKPEIFTSGNDLHDFMNHPPSGTDSPVFRFLNAISHTDKPLVAAVSGAAVGVGTTMLLHCDLVYASQSARFQLPFTQLGLVPEAASSYLLPRLAGYQRAAERLLLGEFFSADEAHAMGLVNAILPEAELLPHARARAARLASLPPAAVRATKRLMNADLRGHIEERMRIEGEQFRAQLVSPEAREAFSAFFEKRQPDFSRFS